MGDALAAMNTRTVFTSISASGNAVWLAGQTVQQYQVSTNGAIRMGADSNGRVYGSAEVATALQRIAATSRGTHVFERDLAGIGQRSIDAETTLRTALRAPSEPAFGTAPASGAYNASNDPKLRYLNPLTGQQTANGLAQQLQVVARMIDAGLSGATGVRRQVFFVSLGGFDTHDLQNRNHADLMARLSQALSYFDGALGALNARNNVTLFTASDFGRTFTSNGDGTDHGWGSHHFVMGGAGARWRCLRPPADAGREEQQQQQLRQQRRPAGQRLAAARGVGGPARRHPGPLVRRERQHAAGDLP
jgi:uncharacterized protein (DUF1501 family)